MSKQFRKGNLLWNKEKQVLVGVDENETYPFDVFHGSSNAMEIPLNEDILDALGFNNKDGYYEDNVGHKITRDSNGFWKVNEARVITLDDLQNAFEDLGEPLSIDDGTKDKLLDVL
jgi:hypothetical protein